MNGTACVVSRAWVRLWAAPAPLTSTSKTSPRNGLRSASKTCWKSSALRNARSNRKSTAHQTAGRPVRRYNSDWRRSLTRCQRGWTSTSGYALTAVRCRPRTLYFGLARANTSTRTLAQLCGRRAAASGVQVNSCVSLCFVPHQSSSVRELVVLHVVPMPLSLCFCRALQAREEKLLKARREMEYHEMQGCTFAPEIRREPVRQPDGPVIVRGLGKFLETKELAKRLEDEQRYDDDSAARRYPAWNR